MAEEVAHVGDFLGGLRERFRRAFGLRLAEARRQRDFDVLERVVEARVRFPRPVRGLELVAQAERPVLGALPEIGDRLVADHVVGVAAEAHRRIVDDELRIEITALAAQDRPVVEARSEEHTSELQSLMRTSYADFCLKKKKNKNTTQA